MDEFLKMFEKVDMKFTEDEKALLTAMTATHAMFTENPLERDFCVGLLERIKDNDVRVGDLASLLLFYGGLETE